MARFGGNRDSVRGVVPFAPSGLDLDRVLTLSTDESESLSADPWLDHIDLDAWLDLIPLADRAARDGGLAAR